MSGVGEMVSHDVKKQGGLHAAVETSSHRELPIYTYVKLEVYYSSCKNIL